MPEDIDQKKQVQLTNLGPVVCGRCQRTFANFSLEKIAGIVQLRCNGLVIRHMRASCIHCGQPFDYDINDRHAERMAVTYGKVLSAIGYSPE
jgi:DNA-directed RNA polymerase subunit RPC12/RpoP